MQEKQKQTQKEGDNGVDMEMHRKLRSRVMQLEWKQIRQLQVQKKLQKQVGVLRSELAESKRQYSAVSGQLGGLRAAYNSMKERSRELEMVRQGGGGGVDMTHAPVFLDTTSEPVLKDVNRAVTEVVRNVLSAADGSELKGEAIYKGFFAHPRLKCFRDKQQQSKATEKANAENELLVARLFDAIAKLKKMSNTLEQWHAYQSILTAIAPDLEEVSGFAVQPVF
jgi:hypothetical protein